MKRIVQIIDTLDSGGKERQFVELVKGLVRSSEIECHLIIMSETIHYTDLFKLGVPVHTLVRRTKRDYRIFLRLFRLLRELRPDIVHSWSSMCSVYALPAVILQRIRFVNGFLRNAPPKLNHSGKEWLRSKITFPFSDAIVANSEAGLKAYNAPAGKSYCIYNGFDINRLTELQDRREVLSKYSITTKFVVGMVGSFTDNKDYKTFLDAAQHILESRDDITFLAVGEGENRKECMRGLDKNHSDLIRFLGRIRDVESLMQIFTIGVLCSNARVHGEGISNSIMEYMALGKPVLATDCGGNDELLLDGQNGYLIGHGSVEELATKILFILDNPETAHKLGSTGKHRLESAFNLERMTKEYIELYREISHEVHIS